MSDECSEKSPRSVKRGPYSRPWFDALEADALATGDLDGALQRAAISPAEYLRARDEDPEIDAAGVELDRLVTALTMYTLKLKASKGDLGALRAVRDGTLELLSRGTDRHWYDQLEPAIRPAVVRAVNDARTQRDHHQASHLVRLNNPCPACETLLRAEVRGSWTLPVLWLTAEPGIRTLTRAEAKACYQTAFDETKRRQVAAQQRQGEADANDNANARKVTHP